MLFHISLGVHELSRSTTKDDAVLAPLDVVRVWSSPSGAGYGPPGDQDKLALFPHPEASHPVEWGPSCYAAFVRDPDGHKLEATA